MGGTIFNICIAFYMHWNGVWVTKLTPWADQYSAFVLFLHALERHMGNKTDPMGGPTFNMCIPFYTHWNDIWVTKLTPWEGRYSTFDNICIAFYTCWSNMWVTQLTPCEGRCPTFVLYFTRVEGHMDNKTDPMEEPIFNICTYCFLHALERHVGNQTDPMGGSIINIWIAFTRTGKT